MAYDVFISYASEDKIVADAACAMLESNAVRCWIAPRDVLPGVAYGEAIIDAIRGCRIMVLVFSSKSNASPHIPKEIERACSAGVAVIPFRIEDVAPGKSLDYFIGNVHWLDALTPPLERHLERLVQNVQTLLSREAPVSDRKGSSSTTVPASSVPSRPAPSVRTSTQVQSAHSSWLYVALGALAVLVIVFAVLYFARKPSPSTPVASAPAAATPPAPTQAPAAAASQPAATPSAANNATAVPPKPPATDTKPRASQKEAATGSHESAKAPTKPGTPAPPHEAPSTASTPLYEQGLALQKSGNLSQAADLYRKACDGGERKACTNLGLIYYNGEGMEKDFNRAGDLFKRACDAGGSGGCMNLGLMYLKGDGVAKDLDRAADFFKRSCDANLAAGCTNLGLMYAKGESVPRDADRAASLYTRACDEGHAPACNFLGMFYEHGRGVPKDLSRATELFKKACDAGLQLGCENLTRSKKQQRSRRSD